MVKIVNFLLLVVGNAVSVFGNGVYLVSVLLILTETTENAFVLGTLQFAALFPSAVLAPLGGVLADRYSRVMIMVVMDLLRGGVMIALGIVFLLGFPVSAAVVILSALAVGAGNALFQPAVLALVPSIVDEQRLSRANGTRVASSQVANITGTAVGGIVFALFGAAFVFIVNGATYILSALSELFIKVNGSGAVAGRENRHGDVGAELREGVSFLLSHHDVTAALLSYTVLTILTPPVVLVIPFAVTGPLGLSTTWVGLLMAGMLGGGITGFLLHGDGKSRGSDVRGYILFSCALGILGTLLFFIGGGAVLPVAVRAGVALLASLAGGGAIGWTYVNGLGYVQRQTPEALRSRVLSVGEAISGFGVPIVYLLSGVWIQVFLSRLHMPVFIVAFVAILAALTPVALRYRSERR